MSGITVILHDIRSAENVGSIFRTADAAGVTKIYLTGYTPAPLDRFKRKNPKLAKAALGAEDTVSWEAKSEVRDVIKDLQGGRVSVVAVEQHPSSTPYTTPQAAPVAFLFGNEVTGVPEDVIALCDAVVEIPMHGEKESLNVSVAAGIVLFNSRRS